MTVSAHIYPDYSPRPDPTPNITAALNRMSLYRTGIRAFSRQELQADCLAYDEALRLSIADRDELRADRGAFTLRAVAEATSDQAAYIAALEALAQAVKGYFDGDDTHEQLENTFDDFAAEYLGSDQ